MILCIDTSTAESSIAITDGEKIFFEKLEANHASDEILGKIDQLVKKAGIQLSDLKAVFVIKGPGSFTGLRVGIAVANQFAHQLKIPIIGLRTDEWYQYQTDEEDFIYLQTMNRDQVYMVGFGQFKRDFPQEIVSISDCHHELSSVRAVWLGQVSDEHRKILSDLAEITDVRSADETWGEIIRHTAIRPPKKYDLIEPFYGKAPTITKSKKGLSL
ncbi:tRNA (adenosine(37)-N6)-threonylcarbamoyltransferase complex dimerization subunit type 1 TsaB [Candidatus Peregrinibacteria bacterium]|nr:tRNA (adenosine(37)-N6)-threonylcarbamoyltransferase complex dimerization subunit type 1 TsaB [Candidatus Peregrinibacteria bacterium]